MKKFTSQEIKEFVSKPLFDEKVILKKDPSWPKISIVTPSYNQAEFLERTILSVLNQNYPNLEYIIIDGGSTDGSLEIIKRYERYLAYWVSERDRGQSHALNKGFNLVRGELVGWQNSDDIYLPEAFRKVVEAYRKYPDYDLYFGNMITIDKDDNIIHALRYTPFSLFCFLYKGAYITNQSLFFRNEIVNRYKIDESFHHAMDAEYYSRLGREKKRFKFLREYFGCLRVHPNAKGQTISTSVGKEEWMRIRRSFGIDIRTDIPWKRQFRLQKFICNTRNLCHYIVQGDLDYIGAKILKIIKTGIINILCKFI